MLTIITDIATVQCGRGCATRSGSTASTSGIAGLRG